ncbi:MAG: RNA polymerase sigma factor [Betaproteobacteria bacterium]|nr:RNA polymerase sigma factor [Betaproteobacteria bacterium]
MATPAEISDFLKSVEKRAFKRSLYHVRNEESALDIVQDSMMKLVEHYSHKRAEELPMLFQRILSNAIIDWFRRQQTQRERFTNLDDFEDAQGDIDLDALDHLLSADAQGTHNSSENQAQSAQILREIEQELQNLPARQREAFLLRYWEEMDVAETASIMGCSQGSVKTHCFRAVAALSKALKIRGITP